MSQATKRTSLLFFLGVLISIVLLSGSLSNLQLHAGTPFPAVNSQDSAQQAASEQIQTYSFTVLPGILGLILLLLIIYFVLSLMAIVNLKSLLRWLWRSILAFTALFVFLMILSYLNLGSTGATEWVLEIAPSPSSGISTSPLGRPPSTLIWSVAVIFILIAGLLIIKIFGQPVQSSPAEDALLQQAKDAMQALQAGKDFRNVIIRCYLQMTNTLKEERAIERSHDMTAREFQDWLEFKGLPRVPVQNLTTIFEKVRYGQEDLSGSDEKTALDSLSEIIEFAERARDAASTS